MKLKYVAGYVTHSTSKDNAYTVQFVGTLAEYQLNFQHESLVLMIRPTPITILQSMGHHEVCKYYLNFLKAAFCSFNQLENQRSSMHRSFERATRNCQNS